jgi:hypothetical protein
MKITIERRNIQFLSGNIPKKWFTIIPRSILTAAIADLNPRSQYLIIHLSGSSLLGLPEEF